jgi:hypothetical protein
MKRSLIYILAIGLATLTAIRTQAQLLPYPIDTINGQAFYRYEVEKSIGLYRVSKNFEVTQEEIIRWNPGIEKTGLRYGETVLRIPVKQKPLVEPQPAVEPQPVIEQPQPVAEPVAEPVKVDSVVADTTEAVIEEPVHETKVHKLALLLPLQANIIQRDATMDRFVDFYEGVLLAIRDLQDADNHYELHVFDVGRSQAGVQRLVDNNTLHSMDAVIGPAYPAQVLIISDWAKQDSTPVLIPFIDKVIDLATNPNLLQFNTPEDVEAQAMVNYLIEHRDSINCVLVEAPEHDIPKDIRIIRDGIRQGGVPYTTTSIRDILGDSLNLALKPDVENIIIFNTQKYSNVHFLMPRVLTNVGLYRITLLSQFSWQSENILLPQLFTSDFAIDNSVDRDRYEQAYALYFGNEHAELLPRYDLLGYDLTRELIAWLDHTEYNGIQSEVRFERVNENGGWLNKFIQVVRK